MDRKSGDHCEFRYRASWSRVFSAAFTLEAKVQPFGRDRWLIRSEKDLGPVFGGTFRSNGTVAGDTFTARYESRMDNGEMVMQRVR